MKRDRATDIGIVVVGLAAAVLTFTTLRDLAEACGIDGALVGDWLPLSWLLPITIDVTGVVAARVWLKGLGPERAVRYARVMTWACVGASVAGNAGQHYMAAYHLVPPWLVVVAVSAVPPAMLGAVVHLGHLLGERVERAAVEPQPEPQPEPLPAPEPVVEPRPVEVTPEQQPRPVDPEPQPEPNVRSLARRAPWAARARELMDQGVSRATAYRRAREEYERVSA